MSNILITGATGFIGQNLCLKLLKEGRDVIGVDNFFTSRRENLEKFKDFKNFKFIEHDIRNFLELNEKIDLIINLACPASPIHYQRLPIETWETNVFGVSNLLKLVEKNNAIFLQASTSEIYGDPIQHPQNETYFGNVNPIGLRSCYDEGKRSAETLLMDSFRQKQTKIKIIRIFNTYGPYMDRNDGRVISNFINQALRSEDITIYGDGSQTRSFMYIDDLIDGLMRMCEKIDFTGPVNLGNPNELTVLEIAKKIIDMTNSKSKIVYKDLPQDDPIRRCPDISLAKEKLDWKPKIDLDKGLKKTIDYFMEKSY